MIAANRRRRAKNSEISRALSAYSNERSRHVGADALKERNPLAALPILPAASGKV
jgi:hypothetical protein